MPSSFNFVGGHVTCIGECMIELSEHPDGRITRSFGGDTLNTAVYLARLGVPVEYITALGDDAFSQSMLDAWAAEGVRTSAVARMTGRVPGLYMIQTDGRGERRFSYWRDQAPAREIFSELGLRSLRPKLPPCSHLYFSGISLSLYGVEGRQGLFDICTLARSRGIAVVFDTNFRARGWPLIEEARVAYDQALALSSIVFASVEDLEPLYGSDVVAAFTERAPKAEIVLKLSRPSVVLLNEADRAPIDAAPVDVIIDTTAAGDSFAAAYLAARIRGRSPAQAVEAGHALARIVVQHRGAIIPRAAMPCD